MFQMLQDYRFLFLLLIDFLMTGYFLFRTYSRSERQQWGDSLASFRWWEAGIAFIVFMLILSGLWYIGRDWRISNFNEQIGGYVTDMYTVNGSYEKPYDCMCTTDKDGNSHCQTCYETIYYRDYFISNNTGDWWSGNQWQERAEKPCDTCEPYSIPNAYQTSYIGMPLSLDHNYTNYIAAVNEDYFSATYNGLKQMLSDICPINQYEVSQSGRKIKALPIGFTNQDSVFNDVLSWNFANPSSYNPSSNLSATSIDTIPLYMDTTFGYLGNNVQADTYIYVVNSQQTEYADMCMAKWKNGSKNSIYVFIFGQETGSTFKVSDVKVGLAVDGSKKNTGLEKMDDAQRSNEHMKYDIRSQLMTYFNNGGSFERESVLKIIFTNIENQFVRQEMATYKNLKNQVMPTTGFMVFLAIVAVVVSLITHLILADTKE